ncbi:MAG: ABC transporter ATP-binding protein [Oscillospiraceae bacterium]|nr:ABC transporter ATP-binding protein [Oscillospiraceae bacterium]
MIFGKHMNRYYLRFAPMLLLGVLVLIAEDYMVLLIPEFYRMIVNGISYGVVNTDGGQVPFNMAFLIDKICLPLAIVTLLMVLGRFLWRSLFITPSILLEKDLRDRMFDRCRHLDREFYSTNKVGSLMSLFTNDLDTVQECFGWGVLMFVDASIVGSMAIIKMWNMDALLTCLSLIPMALLLCSALLVGRVMTKRWDVRQEAFSRLSDFAQESFSGIAVVKAFVKESLELVRFKKLNVENEDANVNHTKISVLMRVLVTLFVESVIGIILGYGGYLVYCHRFDAGQLVEFIGYFTNVVYPVMAVSELIDMSSRGKASMDRIGKLLDEKPDVVDRPDVTPMETVRGDITFQNLTFRYPGGEYDALKDISFTVKAGQSVGIVGKTGSGKTTLVDLLLRTYNVPDGTVFVDGMDVNSVPIRDLRAGCAYVPQDNFLFSDTIANNIDFGMGKPDAAPEAAVLADVDENIRDFPLGYETVLGERGVTVSGGQKQRISIARALLRNAPILILDDSVSAVDTKTEKTILNNLRRVRQGKTTILIAHRISTVQDMDLLLLLDEGRLIAAGNHRELMDSCSAYRKMVQLQQLDEEGGNANA